MVQNLTTLFDAMNGSVGGWRYNTGSICNKMTNLLGSRGNKKD
jgi:hypothetical protein